jgi:hypothetical protein
MTLLEIFKPGKHTASNGQQIDFSEADLLASAKAYNPELYDAPLVIGHPKHDDPAYGWVAEVQMQGGSYQAIPRQVDPQFQEWVSEGRYKKISASFYAPDSPQNPVPGVYYLRHVGFLGAMPPSVKGMKPVSFAAAEEGVIEFMDYDDLTIADLFRNLREFFISKFDTETADKVLPDWKIQQLTMSAAQPEPFMPAEVKAAMNAMDFSEREAQLIAREAKVAEREAKLLEAEFAEYVDRLIAPAGKVLPHEKIGLVQTLVELSKLPQTVEFAEGETVSTIPLTEVFKKTLENRPKQIEFSDPPAAPDSVKTKSYEFSAPEGFDVDPEAAQLYAQAKAYQAANPGIDMITAYKAVGGT